MVWVAETSERLSVMRGRHKKGISCLAFCKGEGELLVAVGADTAHSLAVYHWQTRTVLFSAWGSDFPILGVCFDSKGAFVSCGKDNVTFWSRRGVGGVEGKYVPEPGLVGRLGTVQTHLCCAETSNGKIVSGSASGHLFVWQGRNCIRCTKAHASAILTIAVGRGGLMTGGSDGRVQMWTSDLQVGAAFDAATLGAKSLAVHSLSWDVDRHRILVALTSGDAYEMSDSDGRCLRDGPIIRGHGGYGVSGVAAHPLNPLKFATAGADGSIRQWHAGEHKQLQMCSSSAPASCISYSPDGHLLCVGLGGGTTRDEGEGDWCSRGAPARSTSRKEGAWMVVKEESFTLLHEVRRSQGNLILSRIAAKPPLGHPFPPPQARDSKRRIRSVAWSPDGGTLGVASDDGCVYLYSSGDWIAKAKCSGHTGGVSHFDFSKDGSFLRTSSIQAGELLFFGADLGDQQTPSSMRDVEWATQTCTQDRAVQGAWSAAADGVVITSCARTHNGGELIAGDQFGRVKLIRYPSPTVSADAIDLRGHGPPIRCAAWAADDACALTVSGGDCSLLQWKFQRQVNHVGVDSLALGTEERDTMAGDLQPPRVDPLFDAACKFDTDAVARMELSADDEAFAPRRPWHRAISAPTSAPEGEDNRPADSNLQLEWVHGYRCRDCRGGVKYTLGGSIIFFAGSVAVVMDPKAQPRSQRFYKGHTADIMSLALHPDGELAATGELSSGGAVHIWHLKSLATIAVLGGYHRGAATSVAFSPCGRLLVSAGTGSGPSGHSLAVYDWENCALVANNVRGHGGGRTLDIGFTPDSRGLVQTGDGFVRFWELTPAGMTCREAELRLSRGAGRLQPFFCLSWDGSSPVVGTCDGNIYSFVGHTLTAVVQAHEGPVWALAHSADGVVSGGKDGFVKVWSHGLRLRFQVNLKERISSCIDGAVRSLFWDSPRGKLLIGTGGAEIVELSAVDGGNISKDPILERGHAKGELWGLASSPCAPEYATVGDDGMIRIWDVYSHNCLRAASLGMPSRAIAYSPDGARIAVGLGMPVRASAAQFDGKWLILGAEDLQVQFEARDSQKYITAATFSQDGAVLALASFDAKVYIYDCSSSTYSLTAVITAHNNPITACDFSSDGRYLRSTCTASELFYFEADTGMVIPAASRLKNVKWSTHTVPFSWASQGVWPAQADGTEISCVDVAEADAGGGSVAAGDNFGRVRLVRYPSATAYANVESHPSHGAGGVARVRWTYGHSHLVTIGARGGCILQWRHDRDDVGAYESSKEPCLEAAHECQQQALGQDGPDADIVASADGLGLPQDLKRHWIQTMTEPSYASELMPSEETPISPLAFQSSAVVSVHGLLQQGSARNNLASNLSGDLLQPVSRLALAYRRSTNSQRTFDGHAYPVRSLGASPCGKFAATGEAAPRPAICVWDAGTCLEIATLTPVHRQGVAHIAYSHDSHRLISVGSDPEHSLALWHSCGGEWIDAHLEAVASAGRDAVAFTSFCPPGSDFIVCSGGAGPLLFWTLQGRTLAPRRAFYGRMGTPQTMICGAAVWSASNTSCARFVTGAVSGHLYVWKGRGLDRVIRAHESELSAIHGTQAGLLTGGSDGCIKAWTSELALSATFDLSLAPVPPLVPRLRSVFSRADDTGDLLVGVAAATAGGEVYELSMRGGAETALLVSEAHYRGCLCGLATHPVDPDIYATAGDDGTVRLWSISLAHVLRKGVAGAAVRCISWSPDGSRLLLGLGGDGLKDGTHVMLNTETLEPVFSGRDSRTAATVCAFSPNGECFAMACEDCVVYIYEASSGALQGRAQQHASPPVAIDFSVDSQYMQTSDAEGHLIYFNTADGKPFTVAAQIKHIRWADWTSPLGWPMQGAWPTVEAESGGAPAVRCAHRNPRRPLLAVGDALGGLHIYPYPAVEESAQSSKVTLGSHAGPVAAVRWTCNGSHFISIGRVDRTICVCMVGEEVSRIADHKLLPGESQQDDREKRTSSSSTRPSFHSKRISAAAAAAAGAASQSSSAAVASTASKTPQQSAVASHGG
jgi:WD40 repeat protein